MPKRRRADREDDSPTSWHDREVAGELAAIFREAGIDPTEAPALTKEQRKAMKQTRRAFGPRESLTPAQQVEAEVAEMLAQAGIEHTPPTREARP